MNLNKAHRAQTLAEYAVLLTIIITAVAGIQVYVKRGLQARYKKVVDCAGQTTGIQQYEPYYAQSKQAVEQEQKTTYTYKPKGELSRDIATTIKTEDATVTTGLDVGADDDWY